MYLNNQSKHILYILSVYSTYDIICKNGHE